MIEKIDHIAMVVRDLDRAVKVYSKGLGLDAERIEQSDEFQVRMAFIPVGDVHIELIEPIGPGRAQDFLKEHGEGMYHICYRVGNIEKAIEKFGSTLKFRDRKPRKGSAGALVVFLEPDSLFQVYTELAERRNEDLKQQDRA